MEVIKTQRSGTAMMQGKMFLFLFLLPSVMTTVYVIFQIALKVLSPCITWENMLQLKHFF